MKTRIQPLVACRKLWGIALVTQLLVFGTHSQAVTCPRGQEPPPGPLPYDVVANPRLAPPEARDDLNNLWKNPIWAWQGTFEACPSAHFTSDRVSDYTCGPFAVTSTEVTFQSSPTCVVNAHVNWFPITYTGTLTWVDHSGTDDDYNINIRPDVLPYAVLRTMTLLLALF